MTRPIFKRALVTRMVASSIASSVATSITTLAFIFVAAAVTAPGFAQTNKSSAKQKSTTSATTVNASPATTASNSNRDIDRVIAVVNREVVTQRELNDRVAVVNRQIKEAKKPLPPAAELERQVLERLIIESIQVQEAKNRNYRVTDSELDGIISNIATQKKMTVPEYKASIEKQGTSFARYREELGRDVLISRYREREVDAKIKISDAEVNNFIADRQRLMGVEGAGAASAATSSSQDPIHLAQILVPVPEGASASDLNRAREKAQQIFNQAQSEKDFVLFANRLARLDTAIRAQDLGVRTPDRLPSLFVEATQKLSAGQLADVLQSPAGFHVLKVVDKKTTRQVAPAVKATAVAGGGLIVPQSEVRHILVRVRPGQSEEEISRRLTVFRDQVRTKVADFAALAKKHSEDPQSAPNGGSLGWVTPGQLMPEFEQAMASMQPGQVSDPVRTEYGWHLIQLLNRKQTELTAAQQKDFARATLRQSKFDQAYQDWVRELRDGATVEYREPYSSK